MRDPLDQAEDHIDALSADAIAMVSAIVTAMLRDPDGETVTRLIGSVHLDVTRDLPDSAEDVVAVLAERCVRPAILVQAMAMMVCQIIQGAERAGITVHLDLLASPYDVLTELDDLES